MAKECDHTSVGILVTRNNKILLVERKLFPFGFAPPAGHIDQHGTPQQVAIDELREEVGLVASDIVLELEGRKENHCRRPGGDWHYWYIFKAEARGEVRGSPDETKKVGWYTKEQINSLISKTEQYLSGKISENDWEASPGLEPVWYEWFKQMGII